MFCSLRARIGFLFSALSLILLASVSFASACTCTESLPCQQYSKADRVFTGIVKKVEFSFPEGIYTAYVEFEVKRVFKGNANKITNVKFTMGSCEMPFTVGETYFVYDKSPSIDNFCPRTRQIAYAKSDLTYADNYSEEHPKYSIQGRIEYNPDDFKKWGEEFKKVRVSVEDGEKIHKLTVDKYGYYKFITTRQQTYKIKLVLPYKVQIITDKGDITTQNGQTFIEYVADFKPNECEFKLLYVQKQR